MIRIQSPDLSALVFARKILLLNPKAELTLSVGKEPLFSIDGTSLDSLWEKALSTILSKKTRFGRVGVLFDHHNKPVQEWIKKGDLKLKNVTPQDKKRGLNTPEIHIFPTQALTHLAHEGMADTVEFRRLARKELRKAKHANVDIVLLCDPILGEEQTKKILQHIAGNSIQLVSVIDEWSPSPQEEEKQSILIESAYHLEWTHKRSEQILKQKISKSQIKH